MKAHILEVVILDFEGYGPQEYADLIESNRYLGHAQVLSHRTAEIGQWSDDHPLNHTTTSAEEVRTFFKEAP